MLAPTRRAPQRAPRTGRAALAARSTNAPTVRGRRGSAAAGPGHAGSRRDRWPHCCRCRLVSCRACSRPSDSSLAIRTVEWLRDNGARGLVNKVESMYYSLNAPSTGGPALRALPRRLPGAAAAWRALRRPSPPPTGRRDSPRSSCPRCPARASGGRRSPAVGAAAGACDELSPRRDLPADRRRGRLDRPHRTKLVALSRPRSRRSRCRHAARWRFRRRAAGSWRPLTALSSWPTRGADSRSTDTLRAAAARAGTILRYRDGSVDVVAWTGGSPPGRTSPTRARTCH